MNRNIFIEKVTDAIRIKAEEIIGGDVDVEVKKVVKTNDDILHAVTLREKGLNVAPTIYIENYEKDYADGKPTEKIAEEIIEAHLQALRTAPKIHNLSFYYDDIKDRLDVQCVEIARNRARLQEQIYRPAGNGFAMAAYVVMEENEFETLRAPVTKEMVREFGLDVAAVLDRACGNTVEKYKPVLMALNNRIFNYGADAACMNPYDKDSSIESETGMFVLTNDRKTNGAGVLFYPDMQRRIGEMLNSDYYLLPSSLHEWIVVAENGKLSPDVSDLQKIVREMNREMVRPQDVLSDRVFKYDRERRKLVEPGVRQQRRDERGER